MSERQAGYVPRDGDEKGVRVRVQVQAPDDEIEDLVEVVVARLTEVGLALTERNQPCEDKLPKVNESQVDLAFIKDKWLK